LFLGPPFERETDTYKAQHRVIPRDGLRDALFLYNNKKDKPKVRSTNQNPLCIKSTPDRCGQYLVPPLGRSVLWVVCVCVCGFGQQITHTTTHNTQTESKNNHRLPIPCMASLLLGNLGSSSENNIISAAWGPSPRWDGLGGRRAVIGGGTQKTNNTARSYSHLALRCLVVASKGRGGPTHNPKKGGRGVILTKWFSSKLFYSGS